MNPVHGADGIATSSKSSSSVAIQQRERINGWTCPWHPLQFVAWFFLIFFSVFYFGVIVFYLPEEWLAAGFIIPGGFCCIHVVYHLLALTIDPADPSIRGGTKKSKAPFDRSQHRHVIENSHCYICQVDVGSKSKHCSVCNKCVSDFDHHCKWLNNCVGGQNYRLFIGCISSAFVLAVSVFAVTLYVFAMSFTSRDSLKSLSGNEFKIFVAISSDALFISLVAVKAGLLLLSIALLGHLLGFHIYLIYHKMSTYEFIVSSREGRSEASDVEGGNDKRSSCKSSNKKMFKNKVKPEEERRENEEPERIEISDHGASEGSDDTLPHETTVKIINEVSSKVAAKQNRSSVEQDTSQRQSPTVTSPHTTHYIPQGITECAASSSEESLKEITPPPTSSGVAVKQPDSIVTSQISGLQYHGETLSSNSGPERVPMVTFKDEVDELVPSSQVKKNKKSKAREDENTKTLTNEDYELTAVNRGNVSAGLGTVDAVTPRKKKKKKVKTNSSDILPPVRRPLPQLPLQDD